MDANNTRKVKKKGKSIKKALSPRKRRRAIEIESPSNFNTWDNICIKLFPSWFSNNHGVIVAEKDESNHWQLKTSLHPHVDEMIFGKLEEIFNNLFEIKLDKECIFETSMIDFWGQSFVLKNIKDHDIKDHSSKDEDEKRVLWFSCNTSKYELAVTFCDCLCVLFFSDQTSLNRLTNKEVTDFSIVLNAMTRHNYNK
ncbi:hypothetical protein cand_007190 [Cryptosporidium andersoni]|uniref:Uncharacterized protein n=1 Tax=Cryptosporidium andersoni TaxID=117008 RepID=A0A1J4MPE4_9CRYT|nr:hypothetical protein cand_007190 [Cryptosporidium andersoni]